MYDVIIVGAGPAGLTAALYAARRELKVLVVSKDLGGQAILTDHIHNYPGVNEISGMPLMQSFKNQAAEYGAEFLFEQVDKVERKNDKFIVTSTNQKLEAQAVILCFGLTPRDLGLDNEEKFKGNSVFCAVTEHGPRFKGKDVAVVGGGNSALDSVVFMQPLANKIYLIHRRDQFRGEEITLKKINQFSNVELVLNSEVTALKGDEKLEGITVKNKEGKETDLDVAAVIVNIGYSANAKWLDELVEKNERGHIIVNRDAETKTPGLYAAGDITDLPYKQIITSGGEGCKAAMRAYQYIMEKKGKRVIFTDWS